MYYFLAVDTWPMSLAPTIGDSGGLWKSKTSVRKKILLSHCQHVKNLVSGKNSVLLCDMSYIQVGMEDYKRKNLWRGRLMSHTGSVGHVR